MMCILNCRLELKIVKECGAEAAKYPQHEELINKIQAVK